MTVPSSLCEYCRSPAVRRAIDELVQKLDGKNTPEVSWKEARNYNKALLCAAQVRADFIEFLFSVWEKSFGRTEPERLGAEYFECELHSPEKMWDNEELTICYYRNGDPEDGGELDTLGVTFDVKCRSLYLCVGRYDDQGTLVKLSDAETPEGWRIEGFEGKDYLVNESADILSLCKDMTVIHERFERDARAMVYYLLQPRN